MQQDNGASLRDRATRASTEPYGLGHSAGIASATEPPELPPFLRRRGEPRREVIIIPDIWYAEQVMRIHDHENNWITLIYGWMNRVSGGGILCPDSRWEGAHVSTRRYRNWLETYETKSGIPPHIGFGGAIEAGTGDPTFYSRWQDYARGTFA